MAKPPAAGDGRSPEAELGASSAADPVVHGAALRAGFLQSLPVALSAFTYGLAFGVLALQAGLRLEEAALMSAVVFAGAAQFAALGLWQTPLPILTVVVTTLIVNLRLSLMAVSIHQPLAKLPRALRYGALFVLNDESWALTVGYLTRGGRSAAYLLGSGLALFVAWMAATLVGGVLGSIVDDPARYGLDFAFTAVFLALVVGLWRGWRRDLLPWLAAAGVAFLAMHLLPGKWYIICGGLAGCLVGAVRDGE
ncbi:MAG: AzlC family ABC transporter permease [Chloroflexota bacterium]